MLKQMVAVGTNLFVRNEYGQLFQGRQGSAEWKSVPLPDSLKMTWMYGDSANLYLGSKKTGALFRFDPASGRVDAFPTGYGSPWMIVGIARYGTNILISVKNSNNKKEWTTLQWDGATFSEWPGRFGATSPTDGDAWQDGIEWNGWFYAASSEKGLWRRRGGDSAWQEVPKPTAVNSRVVDHHPRCFQIWNDSLFVGYDMGSLFKINLDGTSVDYHAQFKLADSTLLPLPGGFPVAVAGGRLLMVPWYSPIPLLYSSRTKLWTFVGYDSWCHGENGASVCPGGDATNSLVAVGDTLYALGTGNVMKIPLSELAAE